MFQRPQGSACVVHSPSWPMGAGEVAGWQAVTTGQEGQGEGGLGFSELQCTVESSPRHCYSCQRQSHLMGSQIPWEQQGSPGVRDAWVPQCWKPLLPDSFLQNVAHARDKANSSHPPSKLCQSHSVEVTCSRDPARYGRPGSGPKAV